MLEIIIVLVKIVPYDNVIALILTDSCYVKYITILSFLKIFQTIGFFGLEKNKNSI
jgi:hypothetical protein